YSSEGVCCSACDTGSAQLNPGSTQCVQCAVGETTTAPGAPACSACPSNTYAFTSAPGQCSKCDSLGCTGSPNCAVGYSGALCSLCEPGFYQTQNGLYRECLACGSSKPWVPVLFVLVLLLVAAAFAKLAVNEVVLQLTVPLNIALAYMQLV